MSLRAAKLALAGVIIFFVFATVYMAVLIFYQQETFREGSRYNTTLLASQAVAGVRKLQQRVTAFSVPAAGIDKQEVELRFDILLNRIELLNDGEFQKFVNADPGRVMVIQQLRDALTTVEPVLKRIEEPGAVERALEILAPLDAKIASL